MTEQKKKTHALMNKYMESGLDETEIQELVDLITGGHRGGLAKGG